MSLKVILAEDNLLVREGIQQILALEPDSEAGCGSRGRLLRQGEPVQKISAFLRAREERMRGVPSCGAP